MSKNKKRKALGNDLAQDELKIIYIGMEIRNIFSLGTFSIFSNLDLKQ